MSDSHDPAMDSFFATPGVKHHRTRAWRSEGFRHWFTFCERLHQDRIRDLLLSLPVGAYVQFFDQHYPSPSDAGAWVDLRRYTNEWTVTFSNHGWSGEPVSISFENAVRYLWDCQSFDYYTFLGVRGESTHMAHSGLTTSPERTVDYDSQSPNGVYLTDRLAMIDDQNT